MRPKFLSEIASESGCQWQVFWNPFFEEKRCYPGDAYTVCHGLRPLWEPVQRASLCISRQFVFLLCNSSYTILLFISPLSLKPFWRRMAIVAGCVVKQNNYHHHYTVWKPDFQRVIISFCRAAEIFIGHCVLKWVSAAYRIISRYFLKIRGTLLAGW